jgi:hypothetical protein
VSGTYTASSGGESVSLNLRQDGDHISGSVSSLGMGGRVDGTRSGQTLHFRNEAGDSWTGTLSSDCNSISMTIALEGESMSLTLRR